MTPSAEPGHPGADAFGLPWGTGVAALAAVTILGVALQGSGALHPGLLGNATLSMHLSVAAASLLALATVLYLVLDDARIDRLGPWASRLALLGALGLPAGSVLRAVEVGMPMLVDFEYHAGFEAPALIAGGAVLAYLRIEQAWRTRRAGALVLGLSLAALALDAWLMSVAEGVPSSLGQVMDGHLVGLWHLGGKVGVLASVVLALWTVLHTRTNQVASVPLEHALRVAMSIGLSGFTLALLSAMALTVLPGPTPQALSRGLAGGMVWVCFVALYLVWQRARVAAPVLSAWIAGTLIPAAVAYHLIVGPAWS
ncbi:hypothetical protein [Ideonella sp. A 288]|uniref:hypothetical protein n=1 Tax=Ideonella sp. A 288 TaxID=1962181 RepID=UPI001302F24C|nr:hypothetical protein [Ideonella sp. A 288]